MKYIFLAVLSILVINCTDNDVNPPGKAFVGNWSTIEVIKDGDLQSEWASTQLIIKQESEKGGKYQMINTPYDSIWSLYA